MGTSRNVFVEQLHVVVATLSVDHNATDALHKVLLLAHPNQPGLGLSQGCGSFVTIVARGDGLR